jgi:UDP-N-acetylmuramoylalanine--D-glutamate ligase
MPKPSLQAASRQPPAAGIRPAAYTNTLVVGLGKTGLSCARYLRSVGARVTVTDSRSAPPGLERLRQELTDVAVSVGGFQTEPFAAADRLVVSPGVPLSEPYVAAALQRGVPVVGDVELFAQAARAPVAAITGSNGKSTVTSLLGQMARLAGTHVAVGGNLGEPVLDLLDEAVELYVVELSSFQLETTETLAPRAATVLNVSADHMDRYPDLAAYAAAKARVLRLAESVIVNRDDPLVVAMSSAAKNSRGFTLGLPERGDFGLLDHRGEPWLARGARRLLPAREVPLAGRHNLANTLAALALGEACGLPLDPMIEALRDFRGLPHRTSLVAVKDGISWYDDSKGTNPGATIAALQGLVSPDGPARAVLVAGGDCKGADFSALAPVLAQLARAVVLIGRDAPMIERVLQSSVPLFHASDMDDAVRLAGGAALSGDCVLLSPACASFDMFDDFEHRGRAFAAAVSRLLR